MPDSATAAAVGYARESGIPFAEALVKNRYVGRTFIMPDQRIRDQGVHLKFNPLREVLEGQRVVVVDDTIVRSTTMRHVVKMLRDAGAREVHMRITAPPITHPCFFGIDMGRRWELIAAHETIEEIRQDIGADSLGYLTPQGLVERHRPAARELLHGLLHGAATRWRCRRSWTSWAWSRRPGRATATRSSGSRTTSCRWPRSRRAKSGLRQPSPLPGGERAG